MTDNRQTTQVKPRTTLLAAVMIIACLLTLTGCGPQVRFDNPIFEEPLADPSIVQYDGRFYLYATRDPWGGDTLACKSTADFKTWTDHALNWPTKAACKSITGTDSNVWAPSVIHARNGRFYLYVSVGSEIYCGVAAHPTGPWKNVFDTGRPLIRSQKAQDIHTIDAEVFIDDDGRVYLYWGSGWDWVNGHCLVVELADDMHTFVSEPKEITPPGYFEAPFMLKHDGRYYLMYSDGKTIDDTYKVRYAIGDSPTGPFATEGPNSPILVSDETRNLFGPGHHAVFQLNGRYYIAYHRHKDRYQAETLQRQICFDRLKFDKDGSILSVHMTD